MCVSCKEPPVPLSGDIWGLDPLSLKIRIAGRRPSPQKDRPNLWEFPGPSQAIPNTGTFHGLLAHGRESLMKTLLVDRRTTESWIKHIIYIMPLCMYVFMYACMDVWMYVCMSVCMYVCNGWSWMMVKWWLNEIVERWFNHGWMMVEWWLI